MFYYNDVLKKDQQERDKVSIMTKQLQLNEQADSYVITMQAGQAQREVLLGYEDALGIAFGDEALYEERSVDEMAKLNDDLQEVFIAMFDDLWQIAE